jgi:hypothetical protein
VIGGDRVETAARPPAGVLVLVEAARAWVVNYEMGGGEWGRRKRVVSNILVRKFGGVE